MSFVFALGLLPLALCFFDETKLRRQALTKKSKCAQKVSRYVQNREQVIGNSEEVIGKRE